MYAVLLRSMTYPNRLLEIVLVDAFCWGLLVVQENTYLTEKRKNLHAFCWSVRRLGILEAARRSLLLFSVCVIEVAFKRLCPMVGRNPSCHLHRNVTLRVTAPLSLSRAKATDVGVINKYFNMLEATLLEYNLHDKLCQLFNIDETWMPLDPKPLD